MLELIPLPTALAIARWVIGQGREFASADLRKDARVTGPVGAVLAWRLLFKVGIRSDYRKFFWRTAKHAFKHGQIDAIITDPRTAAALKPYYPYGCKRPTFHDEYLPTFNLPHVHLVDTAPMGVQEINERGVVHNGTEYALAAGDSMYFDSSVPHAYHRRGGRTCSAFVVTSG